MGDTPHDLPNLMAFLVIYKIQEPFDGLKRVEAIQVHGKFTGDSGAQFAAGWPGSGRQKKPSQKSRE